MRLRRSWPLVNTVTSQMRGKVSERLLLEALKQAGENRLLGEEHFAVDGTPIQNGVRGLDQPVQFPRESRSAEAGHGFGGEKLLRDTHDSKTDPEA